jgi:hypothetical protein
MTYKLHSRATHGQGSQRCSEADRERATLAHAASHTEPHEAHEVLGEHVLHEGGDFRIGLAAAQAPCSEAGRLIQRRYSWRGYEIDGARLVSRVASHGMLVVATGSHVFGTLTVGFDSPVGLQADQLYPQEMHAIRAQRRQVCEFTRLAVDPEYGTRDALAALFHVAFLYASQIHGCDEIVIEVNPRHVTFYRRMLGFVHAGPERLCPRVAAPAVLLRLACVHAAEQIAQHAGHHTEGERSLYPCFLSRKAAEAVVDRARLLAALTASPPNSTDRSLSFGRRAA